MAMNNTSTSQATTQQLELPEFFAYYLQQNHGIDLNARPKTFKEFWIKWFYTRNHTFDEVNYWYDMVKKKVENSRNALQWENRQLKRKWGITLEFPFDFSELHDNNWHIPTKAVTALKSVYDNLPSSEEIRDRSKEIDCKERETWVNELMEKVHEQNVTFVVMKTDYQPYPENRQKFEESVKERKQCSIRMMCIGLEWLACPAESLAETLLTDAGKDGLARNNCTVDYIVN